MVYFQPESKDIRIRRTDVQFEYKGTYLMVGQISFFPLWKPIIDLMRPTHFREVHLLTHSIN